MDATDPKGLFEAALDQAAHLVEGVRPDQLGLATPCSEFDVRALLAHLVFAVERAGAIPAGLDAIEAVTVPAGVPDGAWAVLYHQAAGSALAAWSDPALLDAELKLPWMSTTGRDALSMYVMEVAAHGWDLATATGQPSEGDPELGAICLDIAEQALAPFERGGEVPFEAAVEPPAGAGPYARLAAFLGRSPLAAG
ncbi:MAG TPA: TIGR03086 family metal-binding protein [Acidimicrobiales bacterium]|nr:TIGR03086 family metal-binding protein [Acidimicrobiales bacterium]